MSQSFHLAREGPMFSSTGVHFVQTDQTRYGPESRPINYNRRAAMGLGLSQTVLGIVCLIFNCILMRVRPNGLQIYMIGYGIWGGVLFISTGLLSVISSIGSPKRDLLIATMEMDVISACISPLIIAFGILDAHPIARRLFTHIQPKSDLSISISFGVTVVVLTFAEAVISIAGSVFCCKALCRSRLEETAGSPYYVVDNHRLAFLPDDSVHLFTRGVLTNFVATSGHVRGHSHPLNDNRNHSADRRTSGVLGFSDRPPALAYWKAWGPESVYPFRP